MLWSTVLHIYIHQLNTIVNSSEILKLSLKKILIHSNSLAQPNIVYSNYIKPCGVWSVIRYPDWN